MKLSLTFERADTTGRHNDRNFDVGKAKHIDPELSKYNVYWTYNNPEGHSLDKTTTLRKNELAFYKEHFTPLLKDRKKKNIETRHKYRNKGVTFEHMLSSRNTRPEDVILQIGNRNDHIEPEKLREFAEAYMDEFNKRYGKSCVILDAALHVDEPEGTPHVHIRRVWISHDENGLECVNQGKALEDLGFYAPEPDEDNSQYNNAKKTFTVMDRELARYIAEEHGIELEPDTGEKQVHLSTEQYKAKEIAKENAVKQKENDGLDELIRSKEEIVTSLDNDINNRKKARDEYDKLMEESLAHPMYDNQFEQELIELKRLRREQKLKEYNERMAKCIEQAKNYMSTSFFKSTYMKKEYAPELEMYENFIRDEGLEESFERYKTQDKSKQREEIKVL